MNILNNINRAASSSSSTSSATTMAPPTSAADAAAAAALPPNKAKDQRLTSNQDDIEAEAQAVVVPAQLDIEHQPVRDDPRKFSNARKWVQLAMCSIGALVTAMSANIFFPAIEELQSDLGASDAEVALFISLFILFQGVCGLLWSPLSEFIGRKPCFITSLTIFAACSAGAGAAPSVGALIVLRMLGASASSAMLSIAAGTIADMYDPHERGAKVGIYYIAPLLGPALAPVLGGALTEAGSWRTTFYFMAALGGTWAIVFIFFKETFRVERSLAWQAARAHAQARALAHPPAPKDQEAAVKVEKSSRLASLRTKLGGKKAMPQAKPALSEKDRPFQPPSYLAAAPMAANAPEAAAETSAAQEPSTPASRVQSLPQPTHGGAKLTYAKTAPAGPAPRLGRANSAASARRVLTRDGEEVKFKPRLADVSPLGGAWKCLKQPHNPLPLIYSGLAFASQYSLSYTASRTFSRAPYNFSPLIVGVVLLALGAGGIVGSVFGGKRSDMRLISVSAKLGKASPPEERLKSVYWAMLISPPAFIAYAWTVEKQTHIAGPVVSLVVLGFSTFWIYSATLSYIVDSNKGNSSGAVALNSCFRGTLACIASEVVGPLQKSIGDGALYTGWAVLIALAQFGLFVCARRGEAWREAYDATEAGEKKKAEETTEKAEKVSWMRRVLPCGGKRNKEEV